MHTHDAKTDNSAAQPPDYSPTRKLADLPGPRKLPLFGNTHQIDSARFHVTLENWAREFGPLYKIYLGSRPLVVLSDNAVIAHLLRDRPHGLRRSSRMSSMIEESVARGLFTAEGEEWRTQRRLVMRALAPEVVHHFFPTLVTLTERLLRRWRGEIAKGRPVDVLRDLKAWTLDVTLGLAMGQDVNTLEHEENPLQRDVEFLFKCLGRRLSSPFPYWRYIKLPADRRALASAARVQQTVASLVVQTRKRLYDNPVLRLMPSNMLEAMIVARDEPGSGFTDSNVIGNAVTMVFAGEDTTSNTIAWLLHFLARDEQVAACITAEADMVLAGRPIANEFRQLDQLIYIEAATKEAMRLKPVAVILALETNIDTPIRDALIPAGTIIICVMRNSAQRDTSVGNPDEFMPERWLSAEQSASMDDPARKMFPFGGGPRFCPGRYLAMAEIKILVSMLAKNFEMTLVDNAPAVNERYTLTMTPDALPVRLRRR